MADREAREVVLRLREELRELFLPTRRVQRPDPKVLSLPGSARKKLRLL